MIVVPVHVWNKPAAGNCWSSGVCCAEASSLGDSHALACNGKKSSSVAVVCASSRGPRCWRTAEFASVLDRWLEHDAVACLKAVALAVRHGRAAGQRSSLLPITRGTAAKVEGAPAPGGALNSGHPQHGCARHAHCGCAHGLPGLAAAGAAAGVLRAACHQPGTAPCTSAADRLSHEYDNVTCTRLAGTKHSAAIVRGLDHHDVLFQAHLGCP